MKKLLSILWVALLLVGCGADKSESANSGSNASAEAVVDKWAEWEANPEPYGGLDILAMIKEAKEEGVTLNLGSSEITDLSPLAGLTKLKELYLDRNKISDVSPLKRLTNLEVLYLSDNQISDVSPLKGLTNLVTLHLYNNNISDNQKAMLQKALPDCAIYFKQI